MIREEITVKMETLKISDDESSVLIKVEQSDFGLFIKDNLRYNIFSSQLVICPPEDVTNWSEWDSLNTFLYENGFSYFNEPVEEVLENAE